MIRSRKAILAIVFCLLLLGSIASPVSAQSWGGDSNITVGSSHETTSDFENGELENLNPDNDELSLDRWQDYSNLWETGVDEGARSATIHDETAYVADGDALGAGSIYAMDLRSGDIQWIQDAADSQSAVYATDDFVFSGGFDSTLSARDPETGDVLWTYEGHDERINDIVSDGDNVYTASADGEIHSIDIGTESFVWSYDEHTDQVRALAIDTGTIASGSSDNEVHAIDDNGNNIWTESGHTDTVNDVEIDSDQVYSASRDETARALSRSSGNVAWTSNEHDDIVWGVDSSDGTVFTGSSDDRIVASDSQSGDKKFEIDQGGRLNDLVADDTTLVAADRSNKKVSAYDVVSSATYSSDTHSVEDPESGYVDLELENAEANIKWQGSNEGDWETVATDTTTTDGERSTDISDGSYQDWRVVVDFERIDDDAFWDAEINEDGIRFENSAPTLSNPSPEDNNFFDDRSTVELEVDVDDDEFGTVQGDEVEVSFYDASDDSVIGSDTLTEDGTATTSWSDFVMGENSWYAIAEDDWGGETQTDVVTFVMRDELKIRDEITTELIDGIDGEVEVRFIDRDDETVVKRSTDDGTIDMSGLPNSQFIVSASAEGYLTRTTLIDSITQQQSIYLLDEEEDSFLIEFEVQDRTNNFPSEESNLLIEKPLPVEDDREEFQTIFGDEFGAGKVSATLAADDRYRLIVRNNDGDQRSLGAFRPERAELISLEVGTIRLESPEERGFAFNARMADTEEFGEDVVRVSFNDQSGTTDELRYTVHDVRDEDDVVHGPVTVTEPSEVSELIEVPENKTVAVSWEVDRGGETITGTENVGNVGPLDLPVSSTLLQTLGISAIILLAGLFGGSMSRMGAVVIVVVAWGLRILGIVFVPYPFLLAAGMVALLFAVGARGGGGTSGGVTT